MEFVNGFGITSLFYEMENKSHVSNHQPDSISRPQNNNQAEQSQLAGAWLQLPNTLAEDGEIPTTSVDVSQRFPKWVRKGVDHDFPSSKATN